jgi:hypothetical protein
MESVLIVAVLIVLLAFFSKSTYETLLPQTRNIKWYNNQGPVDAKCPLGSVFDTRLKQCAIQGTEQYMNPLCPSDYILIQNRDGLLDSCMSNKKLQNILR